ncbi:hypothetical protein [Peribacillus cavernae]|nr:hypothetical protein [Peribacillus cavernae]MDQ0218450.1 hypothetical protein [Peribacillus cavernae]
MSEEQKEKFYKVLKKYYEIGTAGNNVSLKDVMQELKGELTGLVEKE